MRKKITLSLNRGGQRSEGTFYLPYGVTAEQLARKFLQMNGALESVEKKPDDPVTYTLRDPVTGTNLGPDASVSDYMAGQSGSFEIAWTDVPGGAA